MGASYCNLAIRAAEEVVAPLLVPEPGEFWSSASGDWAVVVGQAFEEVDPAVALAVRLTRGLDTVALVSEVHDSDVLVLVAVNRGSVRGHYNSAPGYFTDHAGDEQSAPAGLPGQALVQALQIEIDPAPVERILRTADREATYPFAELRHAALIQALDLPLSAAVSASHAFVARQREHYPSFQPVTA